MTGIGDNVSLSPLIIGAGIGGLSTAIALQGRGLAARVFEAASTLSPVGAGILVPANAMNILERYGLAGQVRREGITIESFIVLDRHGRVISKLSASYKQNGVIQQALAIHRGKLQQVLVGALLPDTLFTGKRCMHISTHIDHAQAMFGDESKARANFIVGADGVRSAVRTLMFPDNKLRYSGQTCWRGVATMMLPIEWANQFTEIWGVRGQFGFVPISESQVYWFATRQLPASGVDDPERIKQQLTDMFGSMLKPIGELIAQTDGNNIIRNDLFDLAPLRSWAMGRVVLVGDAAHAVMPNLGQGGAQAIEDSWVLSETLATSKSVEEAFARFQIMRRARAKKIASMSRDLAKVSSLCNALLSDIRDALLRRAPAFITKRQFRDIYRVPY